MGTAVGRMGTLIEREGELGAIEAGIEAALGGSGRALVVEAPAGIGKTALIEAGRELGSDRGLRVMSARAGELEADFAFGIVRQLFEPALESGEGLADGAAALALPALTASPGDEPAVADTAVLHGLHWLTARLASESPLLIAVDDAHWADAASLRWLDYLARRLESLPVLLIVGLRPEGAAVELAARLALTPDGQVLRPAPLSLDAVVESVRAAMPGAEPGFARACHAATAGNAFYLRELIHALREGGVEPVAANAGRVDVVTPDSIGRAVLLRLAQAGPGAPAVARAVAVLGASAEPRHVAALAGIDVDAATEAADALALLDVLSPARPFGFVHPIVREAVYAAIAPGARSRLHARAAGLLRGDGEPPTALALHLRAADPAGDPEVVATLRAAASESVRRGAPAEAAALLRRALDEPPPAAERSGVLLDLGRAEAQTGDARATDHLQAAVACEADPHRRALAGLELGRFLALDPTAARAAFETLTAALPDADRETALRIEAEMAVARWHLADLVPLFDGSLDRHAGLAGEAPVEKLLLGLLAYERALLGEPAAGAVVLARRALEGGVLLADQRGVSTAYMMIICVLLVGDELDEALAAIDAGLADARRRGDALDFAMASGFRSHAALRTGAVGVAEADGRRALELALELDVGLLVPMFAAYLVEALVEAGQIDEAEEVMCATGLDTPLPFEIFSSLFINLAVARVLLARGKTAAAAERLLSCRTVEQRWGEISPGVVPWRSWAAIAIGPGETAAALAAEELRRARATGAPRAVGIALHASAIATTGEERERLLRDAVDTLAASGDRLSHARAQTGLGAALRAAGRRSEAQRELRAALDAAHHCGARLVEEDCLAELRATGARPRRPALSGLDALTESERRVARHAAAGRSNPDIAQSLFVTVKTVEAHLARAYRKLGICSRGELATALSGLDDQRDRAVAD